MVSVCPQTANIALKCGTVSHKKSKLLCRGATTGGGHVPLLHFWNLQNGPPQKLASHFGRLALYNFTERKREGREEEGKGEEKKEGEGKLGEWRYGCWGIDPLGIGGAKAKECEGMEGERERDRRKGAGRGG